MIRAPYVFEPTHEAWAPLPGVEPVSLLQLNAGVCSWPVIGGFCGLRTDQRPDMRYYSWCPVHRKQGTTPLPPRTRKAR